ncbi:hypothetical protein RN70_08655 [Staphylococcus schleiferi]|nr:hypothetical protein RN70_08655 [Staphylococcus schleiferi]
MWKVKCVICDTEVLLDEHTRLAKRLKNNPIKTFMCDECKSRLDTPKQPNFITSHAILSFKMKTRAAITKIVMPLLIYFV